MIRVYVAGPYSSDNILGVSQNIRRGLDTSKSLMELGFFVYSPWCDWELATRVMLPMEYWKANGIAWLQVSDAIFLVEGWEKSPGTLAEIEEAKKMDIPIFRKIGDLIIFANNKMRTGTGGVRNQ